jgi:uncharacterized membrane protein (UPF0127 family)
MSHFLVPLLRSDDSCGLLVERSRVWVARHLEPAFESSARRRGLRGRRDLPDGHAIVIAPSQAVHTIGMRFPIDIIGVARDGQVVMLREHVRPWRVAVAWSAFAIVETRAGACGQADVRLGDRLIAIPYPAESCEAANVRGPERSALRTSSDMSAARAR